MRETSGRPRSWLWLCLGTSLVLTGVLLPVASLVALDPDPGPRLESLRVGARLFKALLTLHGVWLLAAVWGRRTREPSPLSSEPEPLWRPPTFEPQIALGRWEGLAFVGLLALALVLRWIGVHQDLWIDEVYTLVQFVRPSWGQIFTNYTDDNQHLLYSLLAHASVSTFGESAAALRLPALLLGLASLWATQRLAILVSGRREALLAVALLAVSYHHVWFSQNARGYTGLLFATVLSTELLLRGLWQGRWSIWTGYAAAVALGMGLHLSMVFVVAAHFLLVAALVVRRTGTAALRRRPLIALVLAATLTLQIYALVSPQVIAFYLQPAAGTAIAPEIWKSPIWLVQETIRGLGVGSLVGWVGLALAAVVLTSGVMSFLRRTPLVTWCFLLPALLGGSAMVLLQRNLWPRFFFNELSFAALFALRGARLLGDEVRRRLGRGPRELGMVCAIGVVLASAVALPRNYRYPKQDFTGALEWVLGHKAPGDRIVALGMARPAYKEIYAPDMLAASSLEELRNLLSPEERTWVIYTFGEQLEAKDPELWQALLTDFEEVRAFPGTLGGGQVVVGRERGGG